MKLYNNFLSQDELKKIIDYKNLQKISTEKLLPDGRIKSTHRNLNFNIDSTMRNILFPKIENIFPDFQIDTGSFLESYVPYNLHVDTNKYHAEVVQATTIRKKKYNMSLLIPLSESFGSNTVYFDYHCEIFDKKNVLNELKHCPDVEKFFLHTHVSEQDKDIIKKLKIEHIYE